MAVADIDSKRMLIAGPSGTESALSAAVERDKLWTKRLLTEAGVPTPPGRAAESADDAIAAHREIGRPVVVKPRYGAMGQGVTVNIDTPEDLRAAYSRAQSSLGGVVVEEYIEGAEYRGHGSADECVAVFERLLPSVTGNGRDTVVDLVAAKNQVRKRNPNTMSNLIKMDPVADGFLARQGLDRDSVVPEGKSIIVRDVNGITSGGDSRECLADAPASVRDATKAAIAAIPGMDWGGTDIIVRSGTSQAFVMEVNTYAAISGSVFPVYGEPRDTAYEVWSRIRDRSTFEVDRRDIVPHLLDEPVSVSALVGHKNSTDAMEVLQSVLIRSDFTIKRQGRTTYTAARDGELLWFAECLTASDLARPDRALRRQRSVRGLLSARGVPQVDGEPISNLSQLRSFVQSRDEMTLMIPNAGRFDGKDVRILPALARVSRASIEGSDSWQVQEYPAGRRYMVFATRSNALLIVGRRSSDRVSPTKIHRLAQRAVDAVRAVPELRWGAVQFVLPQINVDQEPLVEGLTSSPVFSPGDCLLAGSFDDFADLVLEGARQRD